MVNPFVIALACVGAAALLILLALGVFLVVNIKRVIAGWKAARNLHAAYTGLHSRKSSPRRGWTEPQALPLVRRIERL